MIDFVVCLILSLLRLLYVDQSCTFVLMKLELSTNRENNLVKNNLDDIEPQQESLHIYTHVYKNFI